MLSREESFRYSSETGDDETLLRRLSSDGPPPVLVTPTTVQSIPEPEAIDADRARLTERLLSFGLIEHSVLGDGNCQFRSLAHQLRGDAERHAEVRRDVVAQLKRGEGTYSGFIFGQTYPEFVARMATDGEWGDHVTLQAAVDCYKVRVCLVTSYESKGVVQIVPNNVDDLAAVPTIWLAFWAEIHYSSIDSYTDENGRIQLAQPPISLVLSSF